MAGNYRFCEKDFTTLKLGKVSDTRAERDRKRCFIGKIGISDGKANDLLNGISHKYHYDIYCACLRFK
jgi:hypothetical protein